MRKLSSLLAIIICIGIGVCLSSFLPANASKKSQQASPPTSVDTKKSAAKKNNSTDTSNDAVPTSTSTPSPYTTIVSEHNCFIIEYEVFKKINDARTNAGLNTLEWSDELYRAAKIRASEIVTNRSHTRPDGSSCFSVSTHLTRENIAFGYYTSDSVFDAWMNSKGHKDNILSSDVKTCAIAIHEADTSYKYYWVNALGANF